MLAGNETSMQAWEAPLAAGLSAIGADDDADPVATVRALMRPVDEAGPRSGKYLVTVCHYEPVAL